MKKYLRFIFLVLLIALSIPAIAATKVSKDEQCMALNIYWEGGSSKETVDSLFAISLVTRNRSITRNKSICKVVFQKRQFSWTNNAFDENGKLLKKYWPTNNARWKLTKVMAHMVLNNEVPDFTNGATHFYAHYIKKPKWAKYMIETGRWGSHHYLKEQNKIE